MQKVSEPDLEYRGGDWGVKYFFRGPKIDWGVILVHPGQRLGGHYHQEVEETFYLLEGEATIYVNEISHKLVAGDAIRLEAPDQHDLVNEGNRPAKLILIKCPYLPKDKVDI